MPKYHINDQKPKQRWEIIINLINEYNYHAIAEIGVSKGDNAYHIIINCELNKFYLIDPDYNGTFNYGWFKKYQQAIFLRVPSNQAVRLIDDNSLDLVFIDADHHYDSVKEDIEIWYPKVKKGGIISGHDYYMNDGINLKYNIGVKRAVNEYFDHINFEADISSEGLFIWWVKK